MAPEMIVCGFASRAVSLPVLRAAFSYRSPLACTEFRSRQAIGGSSGLFHGRTKQSCFRPGRFRSGRTRKYSTTLTPLFGSHRACKIGPEHLEYRLRNIDTKLANLGHGRPPSMWLLQRNHPIALRSRGVGAVRSIKRWTGCDRVPISAFHQETTPLSTP